MNRKQFKETISQLLEIKKDEENLNKAFKKFEPGFNYISFGRFETLLVRTLEIAMKDKGEWISYFLYERDCKFTEENIISDKDGKNLPFRNLDDLYNLIKKY
jgi:hypothetical protein